jgi:hypothetical protein
MFLVRVPSATIAWTSAAEHAPSAPAISMAAQASQHSQSAMAYARLLSARVWRAAPSARIVRCRRGGFPCLGPQLRVGDASLGDQLGERETVEHHG